MGYKSLFEVMAMFQSTFLLSLLGYERAHAIDRKSDDDRFVLYIIYKLYTIIYNESPSKNPDIRTPLVESFFAGSSYLFFATSGVLMSKFFEGLPL